VRRVGWAIGAVAFVLAVAAGRSAAQAQLGGSGGAPAAGAIRGGVAPVAPPPSIAPLPVPTPPPAAIPPPTLHSSPIPNPSVGAHVGGSGLGGAVHPPAVSPGFVARPPVGSTVVSRPVGAGLPGTHVHVPPSGQHAHRVHRRFGAASATVPVYSGDLDYTPLIDENWNASRGSCGWSWLTRHRHNRLVHVRVPRCR